MNKHTRALLITIVLCRIVIGYQVMPATFRVTSYWPPLGGDNCSWFQNGKCLSRMANGEQWEAWTNRAAACPKELFEASALVCVQGKCWPCKDRGGKIYKQYNGIYRVDLMVRKLLFHYEGGIIKIPICKEGEP